jgi:hypothetical protein
MNLFELVKSVDIDWELYFKEVGVPDISTDDRWKDILVVESREYFHSMGALLETVDVATLQAYIQWKTALRFGVFVQTLLICGELSSAVVTRPFVRSYFAQGTCILSTLHQNCGTNARKPELVCRICVMVGKQHCSCAVVHMLK